MKPMYIYRLVLLLVIGHLNLFSPANQWTGGLNLRVPWYRPYVLG